MQIKLIFTRKIVHLASFWKWGFLKLKSGLFCWLHAWLVRNKLMAPRSPTLWGLKLFSSPQQRIIFITSCTVIKTKLCRPRPTGLHCMGWQHPCLWAGRWIALGRGFKTTCFRVDGRLSSYKVINASNPGGCLFRFRAPLQSGFPELLTPLPCARFSCVPSLGGVWISWNNPIPVYCQDLSN